MTTGQSLAIDLHDVAKTYGRKVRALDGVDMRVHRGEVFGLLGPNGAGKSTLVKIMVTVVHPTRASGCVLGRPVGHKPTLSRIGYLPEHHRFPRYLTGRRAVEFYAALSRVDRATRKRRAGELLETVGMTRWADTKISSYSKGMMQRIGLAAALANDPDLVILDEPTDGVDPSGRRDIRDILTRLREQGKTVFVNSHLLSELEMICDRVAILVGGRVVRQGTINDLTLSTHHYEIELAPESPETQVHSALRGLFDGVPEADRPRDLPAGGWYTLAGAPGRSGHTLHVNTVEPRLIQPVIDALRRAGLTLHSIKRVRQSLEDLYMEAMDSGKTGVGA